MNEMVAAVEDPFSGEYIYSPLRTLTLHTTASEYGKVAEAVRRLAEANGYKFRIGSPTGRPESIVVVAWTGDIVLEGGDAPDGNGMRFYAYWNGDIADNAALDRITEQLRAHLAPFGPVNVTTAPPGAASRRMPSGR